jgi:hypothetical protein
VFTLRAVQYPATIPISLASFNLIQDTAYTFSRAIVRLVEETSTVAEVLGNVRKLYGIADIPNQVSEGSEPFPEDQQSLLFGISVEFRWVLFPWLAWLIVVIVVHKGMCPSNTQAAKALRCEMYPSESVKDSSAYNVSLFHSALLPDDEKSR